jgi:5'(3')-deoxyribonucleotidase
VIIKKIFFDLDGVLADFDRGVIELAHSQVLDQASEDFVREDKMWSDISKVPHFYFNLSPMPGALKMFNEVYAEYGDRVEILSGIPKPRRGVVDAAEDKIRWSHLYLSPNIKVNIVFKEQKKNFCSGIDCILIDDLNANIESWKNSGGIGILHISPDSTLSELRSIELM